MPSRKKWLQFGSGTLIFLMFCAAGFFAGYRWGHETWLEDQNSNLVSVRRYYVGDILTPSRGEAELDALADFIKDQVPLVPGGYEEFDIRTFHRSSNLVVKHTGDGHEQISTLLDELRALNANSE